jgi:hypothetical protein
MTDPFFGFAYCVDVVKFPKMSQADIKKCASSHLYYGWIFATGHNERDSFFVEAGVVDSRDIDSMVGKIAPDSVLVANFGAACVLKGKSKCECLDIDVFLQKESLKKDDTSRKRQSAFFKSVLANYEKAFGKSAFREMLRSQRLSSIEPELFRAVVAEYLKEPEKGK